jgi:hypothetical protein
MDQNNASQQGTPTENLPEVSVPTSTVLSPQPQHTPAPVQFSLRSMLWFMVACSAYFAQLAAGVEYNTHWETADRPGGITGLTIVVAWLVLAVFYLQIRLRRILLIHGFALFCIVPFIIFFLFMAPDLFFREFDVLLEALLAGLFAGSFFSLPSSLVMMIVWALGRNRPELK